MATILAFSDLKIMLELENASFSDYPDLQLIADQTHTALENYCGRMLDYKQKRTETGFFETDSLQLDVEALPIVSITSLTIDDDSITDYTINRYGLTLTGSYITKAYTVVISGGYKEIPEDVYRAELSQVIYEYQQKNNIGTTNFSNGGGTTSSPGFVLLPEVKRLLDPFTHPKRMGV